MESDIFAPIHKYPMQNQLIERLQYALRKTELLELTAALEQEGCTLEFEIPDDLLKVLRAGKVAVFALKESPDIEERIGIPVDLTGFASGFDSLP